jgi:hypothetical protein
MTSGGICRWGRKNRLLKWRAAACREQVTIHYRCRRRHGLTRRATLKCLNVKKRAWLRQCAMKALKASICVVVTALTLSLSLGAPSYAAEDEASTLSQQMKELYRAGKYTEELPLAQKSLALREKEFGPDDANVAMPLNDLGTIHYNLGQYG